MTKDGSGDKGVQDIHLRFNHILSFVLECIRHGHEPFRCNQGPRSPHEIPHNIFVGIFGVVEFIKFT